MMSPKQLAEAVNKRRTFAIISHPDAGKTTITEQLLLFGGLFVKPGPLKLGRPVTLPSRIGWKSKRSGEFLLLLP